jgi:hypothetical protein
MLSFLTDELVWAAIREREDEVRSIHPHTAGWPRRERSTHPPSPVSPRPTALTVGAEQAPQYH